MHIPKWLIATAALICVALIAAIAFLIGRETSRPPAAAIAAAPLAQEPSAARESAPAESKPPDAGASARSTAVITAAVNGTASSYATPASAGAPASASDNSQATVEARARVAAYFQQMEAIQSAGTAGDPQEFATTLVNAAASGDFSALDELVRSAGDAERRAAAIQAPGECAEYHRLAMALLADSRIMMASIRDGLKRNDADALTSMAASAQNLKSRSDSLSKAEQALRARFGL